MLFCSGGAAIGHTLSGVRVQRVQKVMVAILPQIIKKGRGSAAGCVEGLHRFAQGATALQAVKLKNLKKEP